MYANASHSPHMLHAVLILAKISLAGYASAAGPCGELALEIAMSSKLEYGGLSKDGTFISLSGNPYNAYLYCAAPGSMSLRFLGPKPPVDDWYAASSNAPARSSSENAEIISLTLGRLAEATLTNSSTSALWGIAAPYRNNVGYCIV